MKKLIRGIAWIFGILILLFVLFLVVATLTDYKPPVQVELYVSDHPDTLDVYDTLNLMTWNIGYCGLGKDMDFFYDGGKQVRTSKKHTINNLKAIRNFLIHNDTMDAFFLQEVDVSSKRTYHIHEVDTLRKYLPQYKVFLALNYKVFYVPVPVLHPMGGVKSGVVLISRNEPLRVDRMDYPGQYNWPTRLFMLDRCFLVARYPLKDGTQWLLIDTHNSAFDNGELKKEEMAFLKDFIMREQQKGNKVVVGGDWNQNPPGFQDKTFNNMSGYKRFVLNQIPEDYLPVGWTWAYDRSHMTNRSNLTPFDPEKTPTTLIDFFLLSPGVKCLSIQGIDLGFEHSDHNPVRTRLCFEPTISQ